MNLRELVDTVDVPETQVADDAWDLAHSRLVRRRALAAAGAGVVVATVLIGATAIPGGRRVAPTPAPQTPSGTPTGQAASHLPVIIARPDWEALASGQALDPRGDASPLSSDPVTRAALVMGDPDDQAAAYVLGEDGRWRVLDAEGLVPTSDGFYTSSIVRPAGLSPDGERLAIPQMDALVVVDLTTGSSTRFDVPGPQHDVSWLDTFDVLVSREGAATATIVDTDSGEVTRSELAPETKATDDGTLLSWPREPGTLFSWHGELVRSAVGNGGGFQVTVPLTYDGIAVVISGGGPYQEPAPPYPPKAVTRNVGIAAVDLATWDPVGYVPVAPYLESKGTSSVLLGWRGDRPVLGLVYDKLGHEQLFVVAWDIAAGTLEPLAKLPSYNVSWGFGL